MYDSLQHRFDRKFCPKARLVARIGLMRAARLQLFIQRRKAGAVVVTPGKVDINCTERQPFERLAVVPESLPRGIVGVDDCASLVDFEHHFADRLECLPQRPERVLRKTLAIDRLTRNQHAVKTSVDREHGCQFDPHPATLSSRQLVFTLNRCAVAALTNPLQLGDQIR